MTGCCNPICNGLFIHLILGRLEKNGGNSFETNSHTRKKKKEKLQFLYIFKNKLRNNNNTIINTHINK